MELQEDWEIEKFPLVSLVRWVSLISTLACLVLGLLEPLFFLLLLIPGSWLLNTVLPRGKSDNGSKARREFEAWAALNELSLELSDLDVLELLRPLRIVGSYRALFQGAKGDNDGQPFWIGRLALYEDGIEGIDRLHFENTLAIFRLPEQVGGTLQILPAGNAHPILGGAFELPVVSFESHDFNEKFAVYSDDRKFAYGLVTLLVMEALLEWPDSELLLRDGVLVVNATKSIQLNAKSAEHLYQLGLKVARALPRYTPEDWWFKEEEKERSTEVKKQRSSERRHKAELEQPTISSIELLPSSPLVNSSFSSSFFTSLLL